MGMVGIRDIVNCLPEINHCVGFYNGFPCAS